MKKTIVILLVLFMVSSVSFSKSRTGNLYGYVRAIDGSSAQGAIVSLLDSIGIQKAITDSQGQFQFLNILPGEYDLTVTLKSFNTKEDKVTIKANQSTNTIIEMKKSQDVNNVAPGQSLIQETLKVSSESPLLDVRKKLGTISISKEELERIPSARDPWSVLNQVPGVLSDRADVGGSESGERTNYLGPGTSGDYNQFYIDGIQITDSFNSYAPPGYFGIDLIEDIDITTGGTDAQHQTNGMIVNIVTKKGGNQLGGAFTAYSRVFTLPVGDISSPPYYSEGDWNAPELDSNIYGAANFGGPVIKDKIWFFGNLSGISKKGTSELGFEDKSIQTTGYGRIDTNIKLQDKDGMGTVRFFFDGKNGEDPYILDQPFLQTPRDQKDNFGFGSISISPSLGKLSLNWDAHYSKSLDERKPLGSDMDQNDYYASANDWILKQYENELKNLGPGPYDQTDRNAFNTSLDGNYFLEGALGGDHEIRFGVDYYTADTLDTSKYPNQRILFINPDAPEYNYITLNPGSQKDVSFNRYSAYIQDTIDFGKLTVDFGVRYDKEQVRINPFDPLPLTWYEPGTPHHGESLYPGLFGTPGPEEPFDIPAFFDKLAPRVGFAYDILGDGTHIVKGSAGQYMQQSNASLYNPYFHPRYMQIDWDDSNKDDTPQWYELGYPFYHYPHYPLDSWDPDTGPPNVEWDPDFRTPWLCEWMLGYEWNFCDDYTFDIHYKRTRTHNQVYTVGQTGTIVPYTLGILPDGSLEGLDNWKKAGDLPIGDTIVPYYVQIVDPIGLYYSNMEESYDSYWHLELDLSKKLSQGWMLDASFLFSNWTRHLDRDEIFNKNNFEYFNEGSAVFTFPESQLQDTYVNSRWQIKFSGLYQLPWGINATGLFQAREGYIIPYNELYQSSQGLQTMYEGDKKVGDDRLPTFWMLNLGLEKTFKVTDSTDVTLFGEGHNITSNRTTLQVNPDLGPNQGDVQRILHPGVFQFGVRVSF